MKLVRLRIRNFRCFKDEIAFDFDDMTAIVGRNDAGKSTVMDALDIFLNDGAPDKNDATKNGDGKDLTIICEFTNLPSQVVIDDNVPTTFEAEYLLDARGFLEIHKTYSGHTATPKCTSIAAYAIHPIAKVVSDLMQLKNPELKKRAKELDVDLNGIDQKVNAQLRQRIRDSVGGLELQPVMVLLNEENAKKAWEGIKAYIPVFALFKSDRASTDQDPEAQDPLKTAVKEAIKQRETELNAIAAHVETEVRRIAEKTLEKIKEMDPSLARQLNPQIVVKKWDTLFNVSITGDEDIPINKRGSGVKRLILLNFFRAKAEQQARERSNSPVIYAIEEPETSQHPHNQRLLVQSLGVLPDNSIKLFVGVEGKHDIAFLKNISKAVRLMGVDVLDLEKMELDGELIFFPLGGSSLALWISRLAPLSRPEFHLFDRDNQPPAVSKYQAEADVMNKRAGCKAVITGKMEMENYLHFEAINEAYTQRSNITLGLTSNFGDFDDVPAKVAEIVHSLSGSQKVWGDLGKDVRDRKVANAKRIINHDAALLMTVKRLRKIDPNAHVLGWFDEMKKLSGL